jgi:hypothetical protein
MTEPIKLPPDDGDEECVPPVARVLNPPDSIWLCYGDLWDGSVEHNDLMSHDDAVTWCDIQQDAADVQYVRADLSALAVEQATAGLRDELAGMYVKQRIAEDQTTQRIARAIEQATAVWRERLLSSEYDGVLKAERIDRLCEQLKKAEAEREEARKALGDLMGTWSAQCDLLQKTEKERNEARAELARLTTLRPASEHDTQNEALWWNSADDFVSASYFPDGRYWTPLPPVKEATDDQG